LASIGKSVCGSVSVRHVSGRLTGCSTDWHSAGADAGADRSASWVEVSGGRNRSGAGGDTDADSGANAPEDGRKCELNGAECASAVASGFRVRVRP
jgi:hypothetical protein